ncbi:DUF2478 domain-containing protein [Terasakiella sp. A23]|uniref:DUF2478 domain-containing protein n=1 Tax=Terasakiella sp. FCG-A23 TaxID=3080561 RepID=UPI002955707A|nr:DUF2478 domain-containing protein [Terasakiella sp. A23]MDV7338989.1 DUF2478 domain-containing protein [Terasakiella sp. A23]
MSTHSAKPIRLGGVLYAADTPERNALRDFATTLQKRGWHVAGLVQELAYDETGEKIGLDAIDIRTGEHLPLARPSKEDREHGTCGFDVGKLSETTKVLRNAMNAPADLLVIEKFGEREQDGRGLADEIVEAAMAGIPTLVAVPATALETWNEFTGRLGSLLPHDVTSMWDWWPKWNLYKELTLGIDDSPVKKVVIGENAIFVEGAHGCGVTANPTGETGYTVDPDATLKSLAEHTQKRQTPLQHAIGVAAILAHYNRYDLKGPDNSGLDHFKGRDDSVLVIGSFPANKAYSENSMVLSSGEALMHLIEYTYDGVIFPSHTFSEGFLPTLLRVKGMAECVIVGPETPLCSRLFDYGINVLSGRIINDAEKAAQLVKDGASPKELKPVSTYITLEK